jgi:hypothetical protein
MSQSLEDLIKRFSTNKAFPAFSSDNIMDNIKTLVDAAKVSIRLSKLPVICTRCGMSPMGYGVCAEPDICEGGSSHNWIQDHDR